jgi:hypothetical protein
MVKFLLEHIPFKPKLAEVPIITSIVRYAIAAFAKQVGILPQLIDLNLYLLSGDSNQTIAPTIQKVVNAAYPVRRKLHEAMQYSQSPNPENLLRSDTFEQYANEVKVKARLLLLSEPILRNDSENNGPLIQNLLSAFISYLNSDFSIKDTFTIMKMRVHRATTRIRAMNIARTFLTFPYHTCRITFLNSIATSISHVTISADIDSIPTITTEMYHSSQLLLFTDLLKVMTSKTEKLHLRYSCMRCLMFSTSKIEISRALFETIFKAAQDEDSYMNEAIWLYILSICIAKAPERYNSFFLKEVKQSTETSDLYHILSLMALVYSSLSYGSMTLTSFYSMLSKIKPNTFCALLHIAAVTYFRRGIAKDFPEASQFSEFIKSLLKIVANVYLHRPIELLTEDAHYSSHQYILKEILSFLSICLHPQSVISQMMITIFSEIFYFQPNYGNFSELSSEFLYLVGLYVLFSDVTQPIVRSGYAMITSGIEKDSFVYISDCHPDCDSIWGYLLARSSIFTGAALDHQIIAPLFCSETPADVSLRVARFLPTFVPLFLLHHKLLPAVHLARSAPPDLHD